MRRLWFAVWLFALGWDCVAPHLDFRFAGLGAIPLAVGGLLLFARQGGGPPFPRAVVAALAVGAGLGAALLPWPTSLGPALGAFGALIALIPATHRGDAANAWRIPLAAGALITCQTAFASTWALVESTWHDLDGVAPVLAAAYRALGVRAAADPPFVHLAGTGHLLTFDCTAERIVGHAAATFFATAALLILVLRERGRVRGLAVLAAIAATYAVLRILALGFSLDDGPSPAIFWERAWVFGTLLPAVAWLAFLVPLLPRAAPHSAEDRPSAPASPRGLAVRGLALGLLAAAALGFHDPGRPKTGRVLIDEHHSNWEWSTIALDTESYGTQTVYNYSELVRYLQYFYEVARNTERIDDQLLQDVAVLVLKTPTSPYEDAEVDAIVRFVERGGGLWLVGDHTNVFGMSANLNQVATRFGLRYRYDAVIDLKTNGRQLYRRPKLFAHPVVRHLPPLHMATSSSMVGPVTGRRVMVGTTLLSDRLDYSVNSFFGDFKPDVSESFGSMLQSVAVERGRGRVLGFSDSTIFSNFFMFIRGKPELALGSITWLARANRFPFARPVILVLGGAALLAAGLALRRSPRWPGLATLAASAVASFAVTARALDAWTERFSAFPHPMRPLPHVVFERGRTDWHIPDFSELPEKSPGSFHTFYVWTQRVGYMPVTRLFEDCFDGSEVLVFLNPRIHFEPDEVRELEAWVRAGGRALVMDTPHARHSTANALLSPFGMRFEGAEVESVLVRDAATKDSVATFGHAAPVVGGDPLLTLPEGGAVLSIARAGLGKVVALHASDCFSDAVLGTTSEVPDSAELALYRLEFRIFDELLRPDGAPASPKSP